MEEPPVLVGTRTRLRPWRDEDAAAIFEACQDPETQRFTTVPSPYRWEHVGEFLDERVPRVLAAGGASWCGEPVGRPGVVAVSLALLPDDDRPGLAEVGYWCAPEHRGRGLVTDAVGLAVAWGFGALRLHTLELVHDPENLASRAVAARCGFRPVGRQYGRTLRDGSVHDVDVHHLAAPASSS